MTTYLHIGLPKTGTTAVQNWLAQNYNVLAERGICTPRASLFSHRMAIANVKDPIRLQRPDIPAIASTDFDLALDWLSHEARGSKAVIISSEYFTDADPKRVRRMLEEDCGLTDIRVLVMLRRQDRFIASAYTQEVNHMGSKEPPPQAKYTESFDWHLLLLPWVAVFGLGSVHPLLYDERGAARRPILNQLFDGLDDSLTEAVSRLPPARVANPTPAARFRFDETSARKIVSLYAPSNRLVAEMFFNRRSLFDDAVLGDDVAVGEAPVGPIGNS